MNLRSNEFWKILFIEAVLFFSTLILGILSANRIRIFFSIKKLEVPQLSFFSFVFSVALATVFFLLLIKYLKLKPLKEKIYKFLFLFTSFFSGTIFFESFFPQPLSFILISLFIFWWIKFPNVLNQNLLVIFGIAGVGGLLGLSLDPKMMILILVLFSIYDFLAVYKTKHMVEMAKEMVEQKVFFGFIIPSDFISFKESLKRVQPGGKFFILGGGDVAFPLLFSVSLLPSGLLNSIFVSVFSLFGLFANFYFFLKQKERKPIPALPLISVFSIIGYLITLSFK